MDKHSKSMTPPLERVPPSESFMRRLMRAIQKIARAGWDFCFGRRMAGRKASF
jgi:hypothetical protein